MVSSSQGCSHVGSTKECLVLRPSVYAVRCMSVLYVCVCVCSTQAVPQRAERLPASRLVALMVSTRRLSTVTVRCLQQAEAKKWPMIRILLPRELGPGSLLELLVDRDGTHICFGRAAFHSLQRRSALVPKEALPAAKAGPFPLVVMNWCGPGSLGIRRQTR